MANIRINELFESLKNSFNDRYSKSQDKKTLIEREIEANELLFDEKKLPLSTEVISGNQPIKYLNTYTHHDIVLIREAYQKYIVNGTDIDEAGEWFCVNKREHKEDDFCIIDGKGRTFKKFPPSAFQIHYFIEAKIRYLYLNWLREYKMPKKEAENIKYVLKNESVIHKLFEEYGTYFPDETKESWKQRWVNGSESLSPITKNEFKEGNDKHLILTILNEVFKYLRTNDKYNYIKKRWGLISYSSEVSKYLNNSLAKSDSTRKRIGKHTGTKNLDDIIKPEQN